MLTIQVLIWLLRQLLLWHQLQYFSRALITFILMSWFSMLKNCMLLLINTEVNILIPLLMQANFTILGVAIMTSLFGEQSGCTKPLEIRTIWTRLLATMISLDLDPRNNFCHGMTNWLVLK